MHRGSESDNRTTPASTDDRIVRAAAEHSKRVGVPSLAKPGAVPRQARPKLRGAPAAEAVIGNRR